MEVLDNHHVVKYCNWIAQQLHKAISIAISCNLSISDLTAMTLFFKIQYIYLVASSFRYLSIHTQTLLKYPTPAMRLWTKEHLICIGALLMHPICPLWAWQDEISCVNQWEASDAHEKSNTSSRAFRGVCWENRRYHRALWRTMNYRCLFIK